MNAKSVGESVSSERLKINYKRDDPGIGWNLREIGTENDKQSA
jgi:hypothetical protein